MAYKLLRNRIHKVLIHIDTALIWHSKKRTCSGGFVRVFLSTLKTFFSHFKLETIKLFSFYIFSEH